MSIRLNLLAEAQALEELRRKDPVKRAIWIGVLLVCLMMVWSSSLQLRALIAKGDLNRLDAQVAARTNDYNLVVANQKKLAETRHKLSSLQQLAASRFLQGSVLNALQQATLDDVQLVRLRSEQTYVITEGAKASTNAKPATITEKVVLTLDAKDSGASPGDQITKFKQAIASSPYFQGLLGKTNEPRLTNLSPPQMATGRPSVQFTLECRLPEKTR